jgi:Flp pilus assembly protein TadG
VLLPYRNSRELDLGQHRHLRQLLHRRRHRRPICDDHRQPERLTDLLKLRLCPERNDQPQRPGSDEVIRVRLHYLARAQDGATAVEFALVLPMFLMLVFGSIEFGRLLWTQQALQEAAIAGARCVAIAQGSNANNSPCAASGSYSSTTTMSYIQTVASGWGLSLPSSGINANPAGSGVCAGLSQVTLTSTFYSVAPQIVKLATGGTTLTATACYPNNS